MALNEGVDGGAAGLPIDNSYKDLSSSYAVVMKDVVKKFKGGVEALRGVSLQVRRGSVHVLAGHNGAGKTTLFRITVGLLRRDGGLLYVLGHDPNESAWGRVKRFIGYVPEDSRPYERLTGYEYIRFFARLYASEDEEVERFIERGARISGLEDKDLRRRTGEYSNGMRKRLLIAVALMHDPQLLLLDEPTNGLDIMAAHEVRELIKSLSRRGTTIMIATHNMAEAQYLADTVSFMAYGRVLFTGSVAEALETYKASDLEEAFVRAVRA